MKIFLEAINQTLPMAFGITASPSPMLAMVILLMTNRAKSNSIYFLLGWFGGLMLVGLLVLLIPEMGVGTSGSLADSTRIKIMLGALFLILSIIVARQIPVKGRKASPPGWQEKLDRFGFSQSIAFGFFFAVPNLKNASLVAAGMSTVNQSGLGMDTKLVILFLFCLIASVGVLIPPFIYLAFHERVQPLFLALKKWLIRNRALILFLILVVFGLLWIVQGIRSIY